MSNTRNVFGDAVHKLYDASHRHKRTFGADCGKRNISVSSFAPYFYGKRETATLAMVKRVITAVGDVNEKEQRRIVRAASHCLALRVPAGHAPENFGKLLSQAYKVEP